VELLMLFQRCWWRRDEKFSLKQDDKMLMSSMLVQSSKCQ